MPSFKDKQLFVLSSSLHCQIYLCGHTPLLYHPETVRGGASRMDKVFFEGATCGEAFISSKMSFRTPERNYGALLVRWSWLVTHFLDAFVSIVFWLNAGDVFCVWFSWVDTIKAISLQSHSNMEWTDKRDWRKSGPQQNPVCPSANLRSNKHSSHFLPLSLEPCAPRPLAEAPIQSAAAQVLWRVPFLYFFISWWNSMLSSFI